MRRQNTDTHTNILQTKKDKKKNRQIHKNICTVFVITLVHHVVTYTESCQCNSSRSVCLLSLLLLLLLFFFSFVAILFLRWFYLYFCLSFLSVIPFVSLVHCLWNSGTQRTTVTHRLYNKSVFILPKVISRDPAIDYNVSHTLAFESVPFIIFFVFVHWHTELHSVHSFFKSYKIDNQILKRI